MLNDEAVYVVPMSIETSNVRVFPVQGPLGAEDMTVTGKNQDSKRVANATCDP
jgi:hypothetical protein